MRGFGPQRSLGLLSPVGRVFERKASWSAVLGSVVHDVWVGVGVVGFDICEVRRSAERNGPLGKVTTCAYVAVPRRLQTRNGTP